MEIIEHFLAGKFGKPELCEDAWTATPHFACVIDGATSKGDLLFGRNTSGKMATVLLKEAIRKLPEEATCAEAVVYFTEKIAQYYRELGIYESMLEKPWDRMAAAMAIYSKHRHEIWLIGDCQCWVNGEVHQVNKQIDDTLAGMRASYLEAAIKTGTTEEAIKQKDVGREFIYPMLRTQSKYQNPANPHPYAYSVIDGFKVYAQGIKQIPVKSATFVLASDGYPRLFPTLQESEDYLAKVLEADPLCYKIHKATKGIQHDTVSFDDRAFLKIAVQ